MERESKYDPLKDWLLGQPDEKTQVVISFETIEELIGDTLPASAHHHRAWWGNNYSRPSRHCQSWLEAGWEVDDVNQPDEYVTFRRMPYR
jgi:hypothetical protein